MAIEREIPKDITKYEAKFIGPLTTRQTVCAIPAAIIAIGSYFLFDHLLLPSDVSTFLCIILASPFILCGWIKVYGVPFEKFVSIVFVSQFIAPKHRKYHAENTYAFLKEDKKQQKNSENKKKKIAYSGDFARYE